MTVRLLRVGGIILFLLLQLAGCAHQLTGGNDGVATLSAITVSGQGDDAVVLISADKPLTYTSYQMTEPNRAVIDLSLTEEGSITSPIDVNAGNIKKIYLTRQTLPEGVITRLEIYLEKEHEFFLRPADGDASKLIFSFKQGVMPVEQSTAEPVVAAEPTPEPIAAPVVAEPVVETKPIVAPAKAITGISVTDNGVQVLADGAISQVKVFTLDKPKRLIVDIPGVKSALADHRYVVGREGVAAVRLGGYKDKVRLVFDATAKKGLPTYRIDKGETGLMVLLGRGVAATPPPAPMALSAAPAAAASTNGVKIQAPSSGKGSISGVDFTAEEASARLTLTTSGCMADEPSALKNGFVITLKNCIMPAKLERILDTSAFASAVERITPYQVRVKGRPDAKVLVRLKQETTFALQQSSGVITVNVDTPPALRVAAATATGAASQAPSAVSAAPATTLDAAAAAIPGMPTQAAAASQAVPKVPLIAAAEEDREQPRDSGGAELSQAELLAKAEKQTTGASTRKRYTGRRITLEFADAEIRKIFQLIAEVSNLNFLIGDDVSGNITLKLVNVPWDQALDIILETKSLGIQREGNVIIIRPKSKMTSVADESLAAKRAMERSMELSTEVFDVNFANIGDVVTQFSAIKSERGTITQDPRTNRVIVKDIQPALEEMRFLLKNLDLPEKQVLIEARLVEASSNFTQDLGVQWGLHYGDASAAMMNINKIDSGFGGVVTPPPTAGFPSSASAGGAAGISFGKLGTNIQVDMRLSAAVTSGDVKIISTPKIVTLNNKAAKISQGQSIPYQTTSAEGTKTEFVEAALTLEVTPHITADGSVVMKIKAANNTTGSGTPPPINKKEATTELLVKNGETTVIGGIYIDQDNHGERGVPFLKDIPLLGVLFRSSTDSKTKTELLIFITPKVMS
jgi:type IV pilus assembly protein PilQ